MDSGEFGEFHASEVTPNMDKAKYSEIVNKAKKYIHDGDIFQAVLSRKFAFDTNGDNLTLYKTLRKLNPSPYMYHLKQDTKTIIGASPEMLVRITDDKVETFPIAGTRKITDDENKNKELSEELIHDEKELAEHTMLVDLGRNDIGRVCKYGTVHPESLMEIKRFSHVQHIVSHVVGNLAPENDMFDAFQAVFPAGTVSGAPKVRAMEIIDELETEARGPYAGCVRHGKTSQVDHDNSKLFTDVKNPFRATRYHSLVGDKTIIPDVLEVTATASDDGEIMAIQHKEYLIHGVCPHLSHTYL